MSAVIFIEGGGDGQLHERSLRKAWSEFFRSAGLSGRMPAIVRGGGRKQTYEKFAHAVRVARARKLPVLLVDSEETVKTGHSVWEHLRRRDGWSRPEGAEDDQAFLMVVAMETWFLADRDLLTEHFGPELVESHLKRWRTCRRIPFSVRFVRRPRAVRDPTRRAKSRSISWRSSTRVASRTSARTQGSFCTGCEACRDPASRPVAARAGTGGSRVASAVSARPPPVSEPAPLVRPAVRIAFSVRHAFRRVGFLVRKCVGLRLHEGSGIV